MGWFQKEKAVREKRTLEAIKKNYTGPSGKFGTIAQALGYPVVRQGTGLYDNSYLDDPYADHIETDYETTVSGQLGPQMSRDELLDMGDADVQEEGYVFDGLSRGIHVEIQYWYENQQIKVSYRGFLVYKELGGELFTYAPFPEWEELIERLYKAAKNKAKELKKVQEAELTQKLQREKQSFWTKLRYRWGV